MAAEMHRYLVPRTQGLTDRDAGLYYLVASLFALYPESTWPPGQGRDNQRNLGASFARLEQAPNQGRRENEKQTSSVERRFVALLNSDSEDLHIHLRQGIGLLKAKDIPVDWAILLGDLRWWDSDSRAVQRRWARAFWGSASAAATSQDGDAEAGIETESEDATEAGQ
jgi:CRISPR system Cascade subunit CasB